MLIKTRKGRWPLLGGIVILFLVITVTFNKKHAIDEAYETLEHINAQDWGYSSLKGLFGLPTLRELGKSPSAVIVGLIKRFPTYVAPRVPEILSTKIQDFPSRPNLERIDIDIKFKDYQTILSDRERALKETMLNNPHSVNAKISYQGRRIKAKIRLKGDLPDHWRSKMRMSFRVNLKGKSTIKGFKRFSIHSPGSRQHPYDQIFQDLVRNAGGLSTRHDYVRVFVNGADWGVMNIEEHMSKELLEKQQSKESIIIKFGDEQSWRYEKNSKQTYPKYRLSDYKLYNSVYQGEKYLDNLLVRQRYSYIVENFQAENLEKISDVESLSRTAMVAGIWNNFHSLHAFNTRYYLNPYNIKLEPITSDQGFFIPIENTKPILQQAKMLFKAALVSEEGKMRFKKDLDNAIKASQNLKDLAAYYESFFPSDYPVDYSILYNNIKTFPQNAVQLKSNPPRAKIKPQKPISPPAESFIPPSKTQAAQMPAYVSTRHYDNGKLIIYNLLPIPLALEEIQYKGRKLELTDKTIPPHEVGAGQLIVETGVTGVQDNAFEVTTSYMGIKKTIKNQFTHVAKTYNPLTDLSNLDDFPFINESPHGYRINQGKWTISKPLMLKGDLSIEFGTEISFAPNAYMIVKGNLTAKGTAEAPIIFKATEDSWKGLYIIEGREQSHLEHVSIKNTIALSDGLLELTGGVTFYKSPVNLIHTVFDGTKAEDALNIVKSDFLMQNVTVRNTPSDGFDSDFSKGKILSSHFENIGGDAVDFSGSQVEIVDLKANDIHDKAVSGGEGSTLVVRDSNFINVGVGIASKDGSTVTAENIKVKDYTLSAIMTYVKKDMFGAPKLFISQSELTGGKTASRQAGTELTIDGNQIAEEAIDVKELYSGEVMKK